MITGSIVALVTPMAADGRIEWDALERLVDWHVEQGTSAIAAVGTTGESPTLDMDEHVEVIAKTVEYAAGRIPVIGGTGQNATSESIELTEGAKRVGADACLLVVPYYNKPTQEGLYRHFRTIAEAVDIPQILYNVPGRTACDMRNETVIRLAEIDNIVGIKDATGDLERGGELIRAVGDKMAVYSGDDATALGLMLLGAKGNVSVTANVAPAQMAAVCRAAVAGDEVAARAANEPLELLHSRLFLEANPIPVKWALHQMGMIGEGIRLPLTPLSESAQGPLREAMVVAGLLSS